MPDQMTTMDVPQPPASAPVIAIVLGISGLLIAVACQK